jgi:type II secretory pathway component GspD/PulD (secretin)
MKPRMSAGIAVCLLIIGGIAGAQSGKSPSAAVNVGEGSSEASNESREPGIPIARIIAAVAQKSGRKYLVDPRVRADVHIIGQDVSNITHAELLTILQLHGFTTTEGGGYVLILPDANARQVAIPQISGNETYPDAQFVSAVIPVKNGPAAYLVPILRPLLPQMSHLAAAYCSNSLLVVDSFANLKRIANLVKALDTGTPYKPEKCVMPNPATHHGNS